MSKSVSAPRAVVGLGPHQYSMSLVGAISQALCVLDKIAHGHNHEYFDALI